jgi:uncharacterized protein DUF3307
VILAFLSVLFMLVATHALLDFPLQGDAVAINKNPNANTELQKHVPWYYWLLSHSLVHGLGVFLVTHSVLLGFCETVAHFFIDWGKCNKYYSIHVDQLLHVLCKVIWILVIIFLF